MEECIPSEIPSNVSENLRCVHLSTRLTIKMFQLFYDFFLLSVAVFPNASFSLSVTCKFTDSTTAHCIMHSSSLFEIEEKRCLESIVGVLNTSVNMIIDL